ncbi:glycine betaine ABC transporter substrate-binding protein [Alkalicoccus daliensis]|uniref:Glycine betaine/proline transport system substrate-binding protein n=1 Tax=Alkalicoccus daliensis TaxID=745820 RepID=A0A1H0KFF5_9BACI|nr:glycine betaine ABC transporter substrate-binding protein [Alkalicoccus daliensis]SDO54442.1 glycine betaine/proline transport system substrate-binding protein [Alkalicoccus daliensis]
MKKSAFILTAASAVLLTACGENNSNSAEVEENNGAENAAENNEPTAVEEGETITFGLTNWTSTEVPSNIAKLILEEEGYEVEFSLLDQPVIFEGMENQDVDFFMDAWLPNTEAELWAEYEESLIQVAASYEDVPLGWVVPEYVEEETINDLTGRGEEYGGEVFSIDPGAGIVSLSEEVMDEYDLHDEFSLTTSSEFAMVAQLQESINNEEPVIVTGWRPHSMFAEFDLKFLEDEEGIFESDNVYVISYDGIQEEHPRAYEILSNWSIEVSDLEEMMLENEENDTPFEELAANWMEENRDKVDEMKN